MSEQGYSEITLLECNRQNSVEVKSSRTDSDPSEFTNDIGSVNLQPYDQVSVHSVYVSEIGAEGGAIEFKGSIIKDKDGKSQSYTLNHTAVTNTSATDQNIEGYRYVQYAPSSSSFTLQDNKVNFTNSYYLTSCGETAVPLPRNFATICSYNVSLIYKSKRDALGSAEEDPERNGTANYVPGDTAGTDSTPERVFPFGCGWALDNMYRSREWNASYSDQDALGRNIFCSGMGYRADYDDRIDNSIGLYVREYNVPNGSLISPVDYQYYGVDNMFVNYRFDKVQLRTDNSKYTIYVRNNQFLDAYNASTLSNGSVFGDDPTNNLLGCFNTNKNGRGEPDIFGADVRIPELDEHGRYPPRTRYYKYQDIQELSVPSGYNSTFNIADTLTKQLTDTQRPRTITANVGTYDFAADTIRNLDNVPTIDTLESTGTIPEGGFLDFYEPYKEAFNNYKRDISLVSENKTYKLFRGAVNYHWNNSSELIPITNQNVSTDNDTNIGATCNPMRPNNYGCFLNASETGRRNTASTSWTAPFAATDSNENSSGLIDYMNNYVTLGIKRPEIYETGLDVNGLVNDSRNERGFGAVTGVEFTEGLSVCYYGKTAGLQCITSWEWNASNLNTLRNFFIAQGKYPELFTNPPQGISGSNMTASNTRFLHVNTGRYGASGAGAALEEAYKTLGDEGTTFEISDVYEPTSTAGRSRYLDEFQHAMSKPLFIYYDWSRRNEANGGDTAYTKNEAGDEVISIDTGNFDKLYYGFAMKHRINLEAPGPKDYISFPLYPLLDKNILKIDPNQEAKHAFPSLDQHLGYGGWGYLWNSTGPVLPGSSEPIFYVDLEETTYDGIESNAAYTNNLPLNANGSFTPRRTLLSDSANASAGYRIGYDVHSTAYGNAFIVPYNGFPINGGIRSPQMKSTHWEAVNRVNASFSASLPFYQVREIEAAYGQYAANASYTAAPPKFMAGQMLGLNSVFQQGFSISETFNNLVKAALYSEDTGPYPTFIKFPYINVTPYLTHTYIGADNPSIQFNQTQNRFTLSRLHRAEYIGNFPNYEEATGDEQQVAYKINKKLQGNVWNPSLIPYPELDTSITLNSTSDVKSFTNTSPFIDPSAIFDATSGIYIDGIGLTEEQYKSSLWAILGFDRGQFINTNPDLPYGISEQTRVLSSGGQGFNNLTTNARIDMNQQINWTNNIFGNSLFTQQMGYDTLFVPNAAGGWKNTSGTTLVDGSILATRNSIVQSASSVEIVATNLPRRTLRPYFVIRSDIVSRPSMIGGDQQPLPVVAIVDKVSDSGDFLYLSGGGQLSFTVTKPTTLSSIRTIITDPDGTNARVNNDSAVIYKITRPINKSLQVGSNLFNTTNASLKQQTQPIQQKIQQLQAQNAAAGQVGGRTNNRIARQIQQLQLQLSQIRSNMNQNFPQFNMIAQALAPDNQVANNYVDESFNDLFTLDPLPFGDEAEPIEPTFTQQQTALDPQIPSNIPAMIESMNEANLRQAFFQELQSDIQSSRREQAIQRIVQQREDARRILSDQLNREPTDMEISDALGQFEEGEGAGGDVIDDEANRTLGDISGISGDVPIPTEEPQPEVERPAPTLDPSEIPTEEQKSRKARQRQGRRFVTPRQARQARQQQAIEAARRRIEQQQQATARATYIPIGQQATEATRRRIQQQQQATEDALRRIEQQQQAEAAKSPKEKESEE